MRKEFTVNYFKKYDRNGTVYNQTINISKETLEKLKNILQSEIALPVYEVKDYYKRTFLKTRFGDILHNNIVFMNLTQRDFFNKFLKLKLKDRNTCFYVIK